MLLEACQHRPEHGPCPMIAYACESSTRAVGAFWRRSGGRACHESDVTRLIPPPPSTQRIHLHSLTTKHGSLSANLGYVLADRY